MKLKYCIAVILLLLLQCHLYARPKYQDIKLPGQLKVGSIMPPQKVQYLYNSPAGYILPYKNKLIILDFFQTICGACIGSLPRLNALQQQNNNSLEIILVTDEPVTAIKTFFTTNKLAKQNKLPVIIGDRKLKTLFPHTLLPHEVWIGENGIIKAITAAGEVTQENITAMVNGENIALPLKEDLLNFDASKPLFDSGNGGSTDKIFFRSTFSQAIPGVKSKTAVYTTSTGKRFLCLNQSLFGLYQETLNGLASNRILIQLQSKQAAAALYCYELITPLSASVDAMHQMMQQDIARSLNVQGSYRQQLMPCYQLVRTTGDTIMASGTGNPMAFVEDSVIFSKACTTGALVAALNDAAKNASTIFITGDDVQLPAGISIDLTKVQTATGLQQQLLKYGISIRLTQQPLTMFVVTGAGTPQTIIQNQ